MQVRALLDGQGWFDLRRYRLDPPNGADIHWSRLVDLPLAGLMLLLRLFMTGAEAEKAAVAIAPLLPMGVAMASLALVCRRLIRSEEHTSELQSLMRISYAVFCLKKKTATTIISSYR